MGILIECGMMNAECGMMKAVSGLRPIQHSAFLIQH
jgi:hypothetical protein